MRRFVFLLLLVVLAAVAYLRLTGRPLPWQRPPGIPQTFTPPSAPPLNPGELPSLAALDAEYVRLVESVVPSVVSVNTKRRVRVPVVDMSDYLLGYRGRTQERTNSGLGSGVIVSKEGHILTNAHVVQGMTEIQVQLTDGRTLPATLVGMESTVDIAVLRIEAPNIQPLVMGDSDGVKVGQQVFAIGNPFGFQESVTRGIVSAKGRALSDSGVEFLQTDAAVNPGNSGGPLLNTRGEIIGINSAIYSQTGAFAGISFAIPANVARQTLESIVKTGRPMRPYLGMNLMPLNQALAEQFGLPDTRGAIITDVQPGSPAEQAGLKPGDVIRRFAGQPVRDERALRDIISRTQVGQEVELALYREGREETITVKMVEMPSVAGRPAQPAPQTGPQLNQPATPGQSEPHPALVGLQVRDIPENLRPNLAPNVQGVIITQIQPDAAAAGKLQVGDVIEEVNRQHTPGLAEFQAAAYSAPQNERVLLSVCRGMARMYVVVNAR